MDEIHFFGGRMGPRYLGEVVPLLLRCDAMRPSG